MAAVKQKPAGKLTNNSHEAIKWQRWRIFHYISRRTKGREKKNSQTRLFPINSPSRKLCRVWAALGREGLELSKVTEKRGFLNMLESNMSSKPQLGRAYTKDSIKTPCTKSSERLGRFACSQTHNRKVQDQCSAPVHCIIPFVIPSIMPLCCISVGLSHSQSQW